MDGEESLGISARLAIGVLATVVATVVCIERLREIAFLVPFVLTALVVVWVVAGAARNGGDTRKRRVWALIGIGAASACVTLFFVIATTLVYMILLHPPGP